MTQWLGGMGVIALAVAIFPFTGMGGAHLFKAEVPALQKIRYHRESAIRQSCLGRVPHFYWS